MTWNANAYKFTFYIFIYTCKYRLCFVSNAFIDIFELFLEKDISQKSKLSRKIFFRIFPSFIHIIDNAFITLLSLFSGNKVLINRCSRASFFPSGSDFNILSICGINTISAFDLFRLFHLKD